MMLINKIEEKTMMYQTPGSETKTGGEFDSGSSSKCRDHSPRTAGMQARQLLLIHLLLLTHWRLQLPLLVR